MPTPVAYQPPYSLLDAGRMVGRDGKPFLADPDLLAAANVALALDRPLLLTGEPGCGKTDFAFAAASGLTIDSAGASAPREVLAQYVRSETRAQQLLYHYDAVRRFGDAQTGGEQGRRRAAFPQNYITLEPLGIALTSPVRRVVLIDEIDKAPRDLPNDLLRELDQGWFEIPEIPQGQDIIPDAIAPGHAGLTRQMRPPPGAPKPFVIITSNVERQLPDAFLRRCVFFYIPFPDHKRLQEILDAHFPKAPPPLKHNAITLFTELRSPHFRLTKQPATAELLDWLAVLLTVFDPAETARRLAVEAARTENHEAVTWHTLPALSCLLKLREDLERVRQGG